MYRPAKISTHCPRCAGDLSFEEGANAISCPYCGIALLATGYGRVLSYSLLPALKEAEVRSLALRHLASSGRREGISGMRLVFVPFYRLTGLDFTWDWRDREIRSPLLETPGLTNPARRSMTWEGEEILDPGGVPLPPLREKEFRLNATYLDRSFLASALPSIALRSLGVRSQVLTLRLFDPQELSQQGQVIPVTMDWREAWNRVERDFTVENLVRRQILNRILSLVFFPLWEVQVRGDGRASHLLFDGVARSFLQEAATPFFPEDPREGSFSPQVLRFRPLTCPNCAGALPVEASFRLFCCSACHRVWHIRGDEFADLGYRLAVSPKESGGRSPSEKVLYLPFWIFLGQVNLEGKVISSKYDLGRITATGRLASEGEREIPLRFFIPAFKVRDLSVANRISASFTRMQPLLQTREHRGEDLHPGGVLDREEAATFAHLCLVSVAPKGNPKLVQRLAQAEVGLSPGELIFFPFREVRDSLHEDFLGTAIQKNTLR